MLKSLYEFSKLDTNEDSAPGVGLEPLSIKCGFCFRVLKYLCLKTYFKFNLL